jgi:hypothetical protein
MWHIIAHSFWSLTQMALLGFVISGLGWKAGDWSGELLEVASELLFEGAGKHVLEDVHARLRAYTGSVPPNHDLEHAICLAELTTTLVLLEIYRREDEADRFDDREAQPPPFIAFAEGWLHQRLGLAADLTVKTNAQIEMELENELDRVLALNDVAALRAELKDAEMQVWNELKAGIANHTSDEPPQEFGDLFFGSDSDKPGWSVIFQAFMREAIKKNPRAQATYVTSRLGSLGSGRIRDWPLNAE